MLIRLHAQSQRPSTAKPCGNTALSTIDTTTQIHMTIDNTFTATATSFNPGEEGSLQFTAKVDSTGTGKGLQAATVTQNGPRTPPRADMTAQLSVSLPAGTKCTGGASGNLCLVSFTSTGGFGNCVVVKQGEPFLWSYFKYAGLHLFSWSRFECG